jgi:hypothetical protein
MCSNYVSLGKDLAKKLGKFVIRTWDGIYLGLDEGDDSHCIYNLQTKQFNNSCSIFFLKGCARSEFHFSLLIEKISALTANEENKLDSDLEGEETRLLFITFHISSKSNTYTLSDHHILSELPTPNVEEEDFTDICIVQREKARAQAAQDSDIKEDIETTIVFFSMIDSLSSSLLIDSTTTTHSSPLLVSLQHSTRLNFSKKRKPYWMVRSNKAMCVFSAIKD